MNKYQMSFGDYYNDGHGLYRMVHIQSPHSYETLREIIMGIYEDYPILSKEGMARNYEEPHISKYVWKVVKAFDYPIERLPIYLDDNTYEGLSAATIDSYVESGDLVFNAETIADIWIWMMNCRGAELEYIDAPEILFHFDDGYGCFFG